MRTKTLTAVFIAIGLVPVFAIGYSVNAHVNEPDVEALCRHISDVAGGGKPQMSIENQQAIELSMATCVYKTKLGYNQFKASGGEKIFQEYYSCTMKATKLESLADCTTQMYTAALKFEVR